MALFGTRAQTQAPPGRPFGRDLAHNQHTGWRKLVLVRHGETDYNVKHLLPGQLAGVPLNDHGRAQARATAQALRDVPLTTIVASPLDRTLETATILNEGRGLDIRRDRDLMDTDYGRFSGQCWDILDRQDKTWQRYTSDPTHAPKGVESFASVQTRAVRAAERWRGAQDAGEWVLLVTHADVVKLILAHYLAIPLRSVPLLNLDNASVSLLTFRPDPKEPPTLLGFNWTAPAPWLATLQRKAIR